MNPIEEQKALQNTLQQSNVPNGVVLGRNVEDSFLTKAFESNQQEIQVCAENDSEAIKGNLTLAELASKNPEFAPTAVTFSEKIDAINKRRHEDAKNNRKFVVILFSILAAAYIIPQLFGAQNNK